LSNERASLQLFVVIDQDSACRPSGDELAFRVRHKTQRGRCGQLSHRTRRAVLVKNYQMRTRCRLLLLTALVSFSASATLAHAVLLIGSGDSTNNVLLQSILTAQRDTVTVGPMYSNFTGGNLSGYSDVLLVPDGIYFPSGDMPLSGQQAFVSTTSAPGVGS
jgi:hypothetical protein